MRVPVMVLAVLCTLSAQSSDRYVLIGGTAGPFATDARVFNPSFDKEIAILATFLPAGNIDNRGEVAVSLVIPKREVRVLNDVVETLFGRAVLGAIKLQSNDAFEITSRIYAKTDQGTHGQTVTGLSVDDALSHGALLQLKSGGSGFRTNVGIVNPHQRPVAVTWTLYDSSNKAVSRRTMNIEPLGVVAPTSLESGYFFPRSAAADLSEAWVSYATEVDTPVFAYASVIDNRTTSPTFVAAVEDRGTPPPPSTKIIDVTLQNFSVTFSQPLTNLRVGDRVVFRLLNTGGVHGWRITDPSGDHVIPAVGILPENQIVEKSFVVNAAGTYLYACSNHCGSGHSSMRGSFMTQAGQ